jgi:hypothetical protein
MERRQAPKCQHCELKRLDFYAACVDRVQRRKASTLASAARTNRIAWLFFPGIVCALLIGSAICVHFEKHTAARAMLVSGLIYFAVWLLFVLLNVSASRWLRAAGKDQHLDDDGARGGRR